MNGLAECKEWKQRVAALEAIIRDFHWMARRYADGRQSYAVAQFNDNTRKLLAMGVKLDSDQDADGTVWARSPLGAEYSSLTPEEFNRGVPRGWVKEESA